MGEQASQYGIVIELVPLEGMARSPMHAGKAASSDEAMIEAEKMLAEDLDIRGVIVFAIDDPSGFSQHISRSDWEKSGHDGWAPLAR